MAPHLAGGALIFLFIASCSSVTHSQIDYYRLLLAWPGGHCNKGNDKVCCKPTTGFPRFDFYVNRLIPYNRHGPCTSICKDMTPCIEINTIEDIRKNLSEYWPSIRCPSNDGTTFWDSAWNMDGRCSGLSHQEYFSKALQLRTMANLLDSLDFKDIQPSNYKTYKLSEVERAINEGLGIATAAVECGKGSGRNIKGVHLCADQTATRIIDCPTKLPSNCSHTLTFDPFEANMLKVQHFSVPIARPTYFV